MYFKKWKDFILQEDNTTNNNTNAGTNGNTATNNTPTNQANSGTNSEKEVDVSKLSGQKLQELLNKWNLKYSQEFKFKNNMPTSVKNENNIDELLTSIAEDYKISVREGITKLVDFFTKNKQISDSFNGKELLIIGYTSTTASDSYNQALSLRRAKIVANAIRNLIKQSGINLNIKFKEEGMGENPDGLIILNDQTLDPIQLGKNAPQLSTETMELLKNSMEERQKINRRVKITLPEYKFQEPEIKNIEPETKPVNNTPKPEIPEPNTIKFNLNSFILTKESQSVLTTFCNELVKWNNTNKDNDKKINSIYISSHVMRKEEENNDRKTKDEKIKDDFLTRLSLNRAKLVKDYILRKLGENNRVQFYVYPVAFKMGNNEKKVVINFEKGEHMKKAEETSRSLMEEYGISFGKFGIDTPAYDENKSLIERTMYNIKQTMSANKISPWIPIELFYDELGEYYGLGFYKKERTSFKETFKKLIKKEKGNIDNLDEYMEKWVYEPE